MTFQRLCNELRMLFTPLKLFSIVCQRNRGTLEMFSTTHCVEIGTWWSWKYSRDCKVIIPFVLNNHLSSENNLLETSPQYFLKLSYLNVYGTLIHVFPFDKLWVSLQQFITKHYNEKRTIKSQLSVPYGPSKELFPSWKSDKIFLK